MKPICPNCKNALAAEDINVAKDVAFCRNCGQTLVLSELVRRETARRDLDLHRPPNGAWYRADGLETTVGATNRALGTALAALVFGLFWNGIISFFALVALKGTLDHLHWPAPSWFPSAHSRGSPSPLGLILFLWVFLIPFIAVGLLMGANFFSFIWGRTELRAGLHEAQIFTGVGSLGFRRRFHRDEVRDVRAEDSYVRSSNGYGRRRTMIVIETKPGKLIKFGSQLTDERRRFVLAAASAALLP